MLTRRLKRLPKDVLIRFWEKDLDLSDITSQHELVEKIVFEYDIKQNNIEFENKFKDFLRDAVLTAREADYLISLKNPENIVSWVKAWENNCFFGQSHKFFLHTTVFLNLKYLEVDSSKVGKVKSKHSDQSNKISFPKQAIFLVGSSHKSKEELNGLEVVAYHPTTEFEIIIRSDLDILEIRGPYQVVKDFCGYCNFR